MQVVLHTGAHETDEDRLIKCLLKNKGDFAKSGTALPGPSRYRRLIRDAMHALERGDASPRAREVLLDAILEEDMPDRVVLSNDSFFGVIAMAVSGGVFYPKAEKKLLEFRQLFPDDDIELFMAIRNPASFLPAALKTSKFAALPDLIGGCDPQQLRWSELFSRIRTALPDIPITIWCNEDTPLIWGQIMRDIAAIAPDTKISGAFDLLYEIMSKDGMKRFRAYLKSHPVMSEAQKRRVIAAFLGKFALEEAIEEELDVPGWTEATVEELTNLYEDDVFAIQNIPGLRMIMP